MRVVQHQQIIADLSAHVQLQYGGLEYPPHKTDKSRVTHLRHAYR